MEERACVFFSSHFGFVQKFGSWCQFEGIGLEIKFRPRGKQSDKKWFGGGRNPHRKAGRR